MARQMSDREKRLRAILDQSNSELANELRDLAVRSTAETAMMLCEAAKRLGTKVDA